MEQLKFFLESARMDPDLQARISQATDVDEIEFIAKQAGFSVVISDLEEWHGHDEYAEGFEEDLFMVVQMHAWRGLGKGCDPEWKQAAMRRERRRQLELD